MEKYTAKRAESLHEIDYAIRHDIPVSTDHPFFVDFSDVRGDFSEKRIFRAFNVKSDFTFDIENNQFNKTLLFLGGMRGSGKTSEIAKYVTLLDKPDCFFCVVCNIDKELDTNDVEYMDILVLQIEKLLEKAREKDLKIDNQVLKDMQDWFSKRVTEINSKISMSGGATIANEFSTPGLLSLLKFTVGLRAAFAGSKETARQIRIELKHNFTNFAERFNYFIENVNQQLRKQQLGREVFFVVDGIEKTMSAETRHKIVIEESNRLKQIQANTLFTLPIELMPKIQQLKMFANVASFPFVKICEKDGSLIELAFKKFMEFTYKRISHELFESEQVVEKAIFFSGGSPRELLRIYEEASFNTDESVGKIRMVDLNKAIERLSGECAHYLTSKDLELLKVLDLANKEGRVIPYDEGWDKLHENLIVMEYNDGSYKRVNPIVEASKIYQQYVGTH